MMRPHRVIVIASCLLWIQTGLGQTRQKVDIGFNELSKGEFENLSLEARGILSPAPEAVLHAEHEGPIIWNAIEGEGGSLYLGTGNSGIVVEVKPDGTTTGIFEPGEVLTRGIALGPDGALYAGTSPNGRVYRLARNDDGSWKNAEIYFDPDENYIWDLKFDKAGNLFVATGQGARIYRLPNGYRTGVDKPEVYFSSTETHFSTLELDRDGSLLVGSGPRGYIYRVTGPEDGFALYHGDVPEIRSIVPMEDGTIYFSTFDSAGSGGGSSPGDSGGNSGNGKDNGQNGENGSAPKPWKVTAIPKAGSRILRIDPEGFVEPFWDLPDIQIFDIMPDGEGGLYVGTGKDGRIYRVFSRTEWALLNQLPSGGDVSALLTVQGPEGRRVTAFSSNPARIYRMTPSLTGQGKYKSEVIDGEQIVSWGRLDARGKMGGPVHESLEIATRSGNTATPDSTWSPPEPLSEGGIIASPNARYLQYEVNWPETADEEHSLRALRVFYRMRNRSPHISNINVVPVGFELVTGSIPRRNYDLGQLTDSEDIRSLIAPPPPRKQLVLEKEEAAITVGWKATDPNGDNLRYRVEMRGPQQRDWVILADDLSEPLYAMHLNGLKEGFYQMKITASDHLDNPRGKERTFSKTSEPFLVDLTPPAMEVSHKRTGSHEASFQIGVEDSAGVISSFQYRLNGESPRRLLPDDGIHDQQLETFTLNLHNLEAGRHSMVLEANDENNNTSLRQVIFEIE